MGFNEGLWPENLTGIKFDEILCCDREEDNTTDPYFNSAIYVVSGKLILTDINLTIGVMTIKASN